MNRDGLRRGAILCALILLALPAAGCRLEMGTEVPISAIERAGSDKTVELSFPTDMRVPVPSEDYCAAYSQRIERALRSRLIEFETWGCATDEDGQTYLNTHFMIPMRFLDAEEWEKTRKLSMNANTMLGFSAMVLKDDPRRTALLMVLRRDEMDSLKKEIGGEFVKELDLEDTAITITLHNDGKENRKFRVVGAFVDGAPFPNRDDLDLPWDATTKIRLSNVAAASLFRDGLIPVLWILDRESTKPSFWSRLQEWYQSLDLGRYWPWR